jgi:hypothetical protein
MSEIFSLSDIPCSVKDNDEFGINPFAKGLERFINNTSTPITIALQGEWGSGKTSLMNYLQESLCDDNGSWHGVWINTWEYALMKDPATTLMHIITQMAAQTASDDSSRKRDVLNKVKKFGVVALKTAVNAGLGGGGEELDALFDSPKSSIGKLRDELQQSINSTLAESGNKGFIFFIDDLDRINPPTAVELLELLKNIFTLEKCVFVLAIDYDVVVKGLKPKFGELTDQNEREFRSFFDKIIQVPFSMPVSNYRIDKFLKESLHNIKWVNASQKDTKKLMERITEAARLTVGHNPRSLKRLLNNLSLIKCINDSQQSKDNECFLKDDLSVYLSFALVSMQIAYPKIYNILNKYPCFTLWNEDIAFQLNLKPLDESTQISLKSLKEFDEEWEQMLYRICASDYYLQHKSLNISQLLNSMRETIHDVLKEQAEKDKEEIDTNNPKLIEDSIRWAMRMSAITNLEANDTAPVDYHSSSFLKTVRDSLMMSLKKELPQYESIISPASARVQTNAPIKIAPNTQLNLHTYSDKGKIRLDLEMSISGQCDRSRFDSIQAYVESMGHKEELENIEKDYLKTVQKFSHNRMECYQSHSLLEIPYTYYNDHYLMLRFGVLFLTTEEFLEQNVVSNMTEMVCAMLKARQSMDALLSNNKM